MCKSWCEAIIAIVILVFTFWETMYSHWIIAIAAVILLIHSFTCKMCFNRHAGMEAKRKK